MKKRISVFLLYLVYWYLLFVIVRIAFLLTYFDKTSQLSVSEIVNTFIYGFKLDIAIAAYIAIIPSLVLTFTSFFKRQIHKIFLSYIYCNSFIYMYCNHYRRSYSCTGTGDSGLMQLPFFI